MRRKIDQAGDEGSALIICLFLIAVAGFFVLPIMTYTITVLQSNRIVAIKSSRSEAVRGALRALRWSTRPSSTRRASRPAHGFRRPRYTAQRNAGLPSLSTKCFKVATLFQNSPPDQQRWALATTQAGSQLVIPPPDP